MLLIGQWNGMNRLSGSGEIVNKSIEMIDFFGWLVFISLVLVAFMIGKLIEMNNSRVGI